MTHEPDDDLPPGLGAYFSAARADTPEPPADLMARIEAQALAARPDPDPAPHRRPLAGLIAALGGWPAMAGLAAAACAGVWLGFSPPDAMLAYWQDGDGTYGTIDTLDPVSGYDFAMTEG
ncbi:hypothetical protein ACOXXX_20455 [Thalassococcus sp. BH17M4-6]|uniref:hypothetical protein n=1 Tax=Thalassococcus sp. BH17M4-6 TaxID=3413148 RepID=UPI003BD8237A